jgi:hypothetical protein
MSFAKSRRTTAALVLLVLSTVSRAPRAEANAPAKAARKPGGLAERLCETLQTLPETRKAQCCGTSPTGGLAGECTRMLGDSLRDKAIVLDPADVERCAEESVRRLGGCDWVTPYTPRTPEGCHGILHGRLDAGAKCRSSLECKDGFFCLGSGPTTRGVCAAPGGPGSACGGIADNLTTYTRQTEDDARHPECTGFCLKGRCAAFVAAGGVCRSDKQCNPGSHCAAGRCVEGPNPKLGEACAGTTCAGDSVCLEGRCSPPKRAGETCTRSFECQAMCVSSAGANAGTCGMQCSAWPPAGYTAPQYSSPNSLERKAGSPQ